MLLPTTWEGENLFPTSDFHAAAASYSLPDCPAGSPFSAPSRDAAACSTRSPARRCAAVSPLDEGRQTRWQQRIRAPAEMNTARGGFGRHDRTGHRDT